MLGPKPSPMITFFSFFTLTSTARHSWSRNCTLLSRLPAACELAPWVRLPTFSMSCSTEIVRFCSPRTLNVQAPAGDDHRQDRHDHHERHAAPPLSEQPRHGEADRRRDETAAILGRDDQEHHGSEPGERRSKPSARLGHEPEERKRNRHVDRDVPRLVVVQGDGAVGYQRVKLVDGCVQGDGERARDENPRMRRR